MAKEKFETEIKKLYKKISSINNENYLKANLYFSIIQIKKDNFDLNQFGNSIYIDSKMFIHFYINSIFERDIGYDVIDLKKIKKCINICENKDEQYQLSLNSYRLLKTKGFEEESRKIKKIVNAKKTKLLNEQHYYLGKYVKILLHLSTYNLCSILLVSFILFLISFIVLLPAPYKSWEIYSVTYQSFSDSFLINHFINLLSKIFAINNSFKIETYSIIGILSIVSIKVLYIIFIANYLYKKVIDILNNN